MNRKGINYDIGTYFVKDVSSRPSFDHGIVRREIEIIRSELHCNAVRISGQDIDRLVFAAEAALENGLEVWFSPSRIDADSAELLVYLADCARAAEALRVRYPAMVFVVGCEWSLFLKGIIPGDNTMERISSMSSPAFWMQGGGRNIGVSLNHVLASAAETVRKDFHGPISYASGTWETVDWALFDYVGIDHYRDKRNAQSYREELRRYFTHGKPVVVTEFGCCTYQGAQYRGGLGWSIVDWTKSPPELDGIYIRDEQVQADYIIESLDVFESENVDGAFVFTFVMPNALRDERPLHDMDIPSYGLVASLGAPGGTAYPGLPWEPKKAFHALAERFR